MGQASPPRKALFRPDPAFFAAFSASRANPFDVAAGTTPAGNCGRSAGSATFRLPEAACASAPISVPTAAAARFPSQPLLRLNPASPVIVLDPARHAIAKAEKKAEKKVRAKARRATEDGQREFGFFSVVGEHDNAAVVRERAPGEAHQPAAELPLPAVKPIPATCETVDFSDPSWIDRSSVR